MALSVIFTRRTSFRIRKKFSGFPANYRLPTGSHPGNHRSTWFPACYSSKLTEKRGLLIAMSAIWWTFEVAKLRSHKLVDCWKNFWNPDFLTKIPNWSINQHFASCSLQLKAESHHSIEASLSQDASKVSKHSLQITHQHKFRNYCHWRTISSNHSQ